MPPPDFSRPPPFLSGGLPPSMALPPPEFSTLPPTMNPSIPPPNTSIPPPMDLSKPPPRMPMVRLVFHDERSPGQGDATPPHGQVNHFIVVVVLQYMFRTKMVIIG